MGRDRHPVTQVNYEDAVAYAAWVGKTLPTEAEWEFAARGGLDGKRFTWGDEETPRGKRWPTPGRASSRGGTRSRTASLGTSPVKSFPANGFGLYDMAGNVWEWTSDFYVDRHPDEVAHPCCAPHNPRVESPVGEPGDGTAIPRRVTKGGSHLCAPSYCLRYRPAARQGEAVDTGTSHMGFRCVAAVSSLYLGPWRVDVEWRDDVPAAAAVHGRGADRRRRARCRRRPRPASIGLILADDAELADLNATHMGKDGPTDVLSFPLLPPSAYPPHPGQPPGVRSTNGGVAFALPPDARPHLGDVIVSVERAVEQAEAGRGGQTGDVRWDARDELRLLVTHGTLHVCGWDHAEPAEESAMRALEQRLLG